MAGTKVGVEYPWALLMAECNCARHIAEFDENENSDSEGGIGDGLSPAKTKKAAREDGANGAKNEANGKKMIVAGEEADVKQSGVHAGTAAEGKKSPTKVDKGATGKAHPIKHTRASPA